MTDYPQDPSAQNDPPPPPQPQAQAQQPYAEQQPYAAQPPPPAVNTPAPGYPPQGYAPQGYAPQGQAPVSPSDARMWSMLTHIGGIFFGPIPALIVYLVYRERDPFIRRHSAQALNFQIMIMIGYAISFVLTFLIIGIFTWFLTWLACIVFSIMAAVAANKGEEYTYPMTPAMIT